VIGLVAGAVRVQVLTKNMCRERSVALAEAALAAAPRQGADAQGPAQHGAGTAGAPQDARAPPRPALAAHALGVLRGVCAEHPNPRRGYAAVAGRLLVPVLARAFAAAVGESGGREDGGPAAGAALSSDRASALWAARAAGADAEASPSAARGARAGGAAPAAAGAPPAAGARAHGSSAGAAGGAADAAEARLAAAGLGVLEAALLAPAHVPELASLCAAEAAADTAADAAAADAAAAPAPAAPARGGSPAARRERGRAPPRSYHWQLFQARAAGRTARAPLAAWAPPRRHQ